MIDLESFVVLANKNISPKRRASGQSHSTVESVPDLESFGLVVGLGWVRGVTIAADLGTLSLDRWWNLLSQKTRTRPNHRCCEIQWAGEGVILMISGIQVRKELAGTGKKLVVHVPRRKRRSRGINVHVALVVSVGWGPCKRVWRSCGSGR